MALRRMFKDKLKARQPGTYVDIGCSAPIEMSNTYLFYCYGWRGLCIDATDDHKDAYARVRPEDKFVQAAVTEAETEVYLFKHPTNKGMHRIATSPEPLRGFIPEPQRVPSRRLDAIFEDHLSNASIDFFSIDVEGAETGVLRSNNWERWRPKVVLMECHDFTFEAPTSAEPVKYLNDLGYVLTAKIGPNVIMADRGTP